ncbi:hypothetical protein OIU77_030055 [Salix suchowensis]|uniref:Transcription initiation factor TFIID subunit 12 domain-containing protein n=1 Tax=Salix suchowensis TaxID=1278906 RepID=A0ABQ9BAP4_9ROSI|nr:hypothetical protein OIU77_030055 [Salix suchowensis]
MFACGRGVSTDYTTLLNGPTAAPKPPPPPPPQPPLPPSLSSLRKHSHLSHYRNRNRPPPRFLQTLISTPPHPQNLQYQQQQQSPPPPAAQGLRLCIGRGSTPTPTPNSRLALLYRPPPPPPPRPLLFLRHAFVGLNRSPVSVPESVANASNSQVRQGVMASMPLNSQMRPHQQRPVQSSLRPPTSSPNTQNFPGHVLMRSTPVGTAGSPVPNTSQSLQSPNQLWLSSASQGKPPLPSPSYRPQINSPSPQQRSHIPPQHHSLQTTSQQQHMSPAQPQQPEPYGQQFPPSRVQQSLSPLQQVSRVQGSVNHKPSSLAMSHPNTAQPLPQNSIAHAESDESGNRILSKRSIHELVSQIDPSEKFDPEVEEILADIADEFIVSVTTFGCSLAKHRKSDTLEAKDILLHLDRNWNMTLPGFGGDEIKSYRKQVINDVHKERLAVIKKSILASEMANAKTSVGQTAGNAKSSMTKSNPIVNPNLKVT